MSTTGGVSDCCADAAIGHAHASDQASATQETRVRPFQAALNSASLRLTVPALEEMSSVIAPPLVRKTSSSAPHRALRRSFATHQQGERRSECTRSRGQLRDGSPALPEGSIDSHTAGAVIVTLPRLISSRLDAW